MKIREIVDALEKFAPLPLQEEYDNSGLQIGLTETEVSGALLCLDVTERVIDEAVSLGCNLVISHHPLLFRPLRSLTGSTETERCVMSAVRNGIAVYSAHTNLDNARGGVNWKIASKLGLCDTVWLDARGEDAGSGIIGRLLEEMDEDAFIRKIKELFSVACVRCNGHIDRPIRRVAVCGGAGAFLIPQAIGSGADAFVTGEIGYHRFFGSDGEILLLEIGHYESEQFTVELLSSVLRDRFPALRILHTSLKTNPIRYF